MMLLMNAMIIGFQMLAFAWIKPPDTWSPVRDSLVSALVCQSAEGERFWQLVGAATLFRPSFRHGLHRRFVVNAAGLMGRRGWTEVSFGATAMLYVATAGAMAMFDGDVILGGRRG